MIAFAGLGWLYLSVLPSWLGLPQADLDVSAWQIARSVLIFLGFPLVAGYLSRRVGERVRGRDWYEQRFPTADRAVRPLRTPVHHRRAVRSTGRRHHHAAFDVARIALPLLAYFALMWFGSLALARTIGLGYPRAATLAFTAAGNNFELAIAVAIATFGVTSGQALAGVVGPLIEVPVLVALVYVSLVARRRWRAPTTVAPAWEDGPS